MYSKVNGNLMKEGSNQESIFVLYSLLCSRFDFDIDICIIVCATIPGHIFPVLGIDCVVWFRGVPKGLAVVYSSRLPLQGYRNFATTRATVNRLVKGLTLLVILNGLSWKTNMHVGC